MSDANIVFKALIMKTILDNEYCRIDHVDALKAIRLQYKRSLKSDEFKNAFLTVLREFEKTECENYLSDSTKQGVVAMDNQKWLETEIIPKAVKAGLKRIVTVVPKDVFTKFYVDNIKAKAEQKAGLEFRYFANLQDGESYIRSLY